MIKLSKLSKPDPIDEQEVKNRENQDKEKEMIFFAQNADFEV